MVAKIIVTSLDEAAKAFERYRPGYVISILDQDEATPPAFDKLPRNHHIKLIGDCARAEGAEGAEKSGRCAKIIEVARAWARDSEKRSILIHCNEGAARSMSVAYILLCAIENNHCEKKLAERVRAAAPHADPNILLISEADALMARNDRMVEAVLDLAPCCASVDSAIVTLPLQA